MQEKIVNIFAFHYCKVKEHCAIINQGCISASAERRPYPLSFFFAPHPTADTNTNGTTLLYIRGVAVYVPKFH